ncbi:Palmitoyltransferase zdhhc16 [Tyrophagus putrescentiae]|nr:Palmitoyltransferase zdhhc16 [Tyrophagus putrescentiae]
MHMAFFGPFFTVVIFVMLLVYVTIAYLIGELSHQLPEKDSISIKFFILGVPYWLDRSPTTFYIAAFIGHWLLINVTFYYYKALVTSPGHPSDRLNITEVSSFCKKCLGPKPPRAHHCRICKNPWLNNCIGHYNHRYFFLFCFFAWLGTVFVGVFGIWIYIDHFYPRHSIFQEPIYHKYDGQEFSQEFIYLDQTYVILGLFEVSHANLRGKGVLYVFWCSLLIFILVGALLAYHSLLITKGETCIERHINRKNKEACKRFKRRFHNPL